MNDLAFESISISRPVDEPTTNRRRIERDDGPNRGEERFFAATNERRKEGANRTTRRISDVEEERAERGERGGG